MTYVKNTLKMTIYTIENLIHGFIKCTRRITPPPSQKNKIKITTFNQLFSAIWY